MPKVTNFDVLIVYGGAVTTSASDPSTTNKTPFPMGSRIESYNVVYGYFLKICEKFHLKAAFTTSSDIVGPGRCHSYWSFKKSKWQKHNLLCSTNLIFDKFSPTSSSGKKIRKLLFSSTTVKPFNDKVLFDLFFDKQKTYESLSAHAIPTISLVENNLASIDEACNALEKIMSTHTGIKDFSRDIVLKDRFGSGGQNVYKFQANQAKDMLSVMDKNANISFIIQPFVKFDKGFSHNNLPASTDIRLIYLGGKIVQSYIRVAKSKEFRCNEHQGGSLTYLSLREIPKALIRKANVIAKSLNKQHSLYSLDFIISNNGNIYFLEGNTGPGLDWNLALKDNATKAKKLIRLIVQELVTRSAVAT